MSDFLRYGFALFTLIIIIFIINLIRKNRLNLKYSLVWLFTTTIMLIISLIPNFLEKIAHLLGFELVSNMIFVMGILLLLLVTISLTVIVSGQSDKIRLLIQEVSILKKEKEDKK